MEEETIEPSPVCEDEEREKANETLQELIEVFNRRKLRVQDIVVVYGNLGYALGASIEGVKDGQGPTIDELQQRYYSEPTLGVSLMLQGYLVTSWHDQVSKGLTIDSLKETKKDV